MMPYLFFCFYLDGKASVPPIMNWFGVQSTKLASIADSNQDKILLSLNMTKMEYSWKRRNFCLKQLPLPVTKNSFTFYLHQMITQNWIFFNLDNGIRWNILQYFDFNQVCHSIQLHDVHLSCIVFVCLKNSITILLKVMNFTFREDCWNGKVPSPNV